MPVERPNLRMALRNDIVIKGIRVVINPRSGKAESNAQPKEIHNPRSAGTGDVLAEAGSLFRIGRWTG